MKQIFRFRNCIFLILALLLSSFYLSNYSLSTSYYKIPLPEEGAPIRIVQLSDLHNSVFGDGNQKLIDAVRAQSPDLILLTGDLLNASDPDTSIVSELTTQLSLIAPTYISYGNHEKDHEIAFGSDIAALFEQAGAAVLEYDYLDIDINGHALRLGGAYGYCLPAHCSEAREKDTTFLNSFQDTDRHTILMCHMPVCWIINDSLNQWDVDVIFAGHAHGGQIRIPFIGGLHAPDQGWFPGREAGLYCSDDAQKVMVLSRGLGTSGRIPRLNNIPEIVVVDFVPE